MKIVTSTDAPPAPAHQPAAQSGSLWLGVATVFLLLALAWSVLFTVARSTKVESVPLAPRGGRP